MSKGTKFFCLYGVLNNVTDTYDLYKKYQNNFENLQFLCFKFQEFMFHTLSCTTVHYDPLLENFISIPIIMVSIFLWAEESF
jgi:hypothetical protein